MAILISLRKSASFGFDKKTDRTTITKFIYDGLDVLADDNAGTLTKYLNGLGIDNNLREQTGVILQIKHR